jgi:hypothetical protein
MRGTSSQAAGVSPNARLLLVLNGALFQEGKGVACHSAQIAEPCRHVRLGRNPILVGPDRVDEKTAIGGPSQDERGDLFDWAVIVQVNEFAHSFGFLAPRGTVSVSDASEGSGGGSCAVRALSSICFPFPIPLAYSMYSRALTAALAISLSRAVLASTKANIRCCSVVIG